MTFANRFVGTLGLAILASTPLAAEQSGIQPQIAVVGEGVITIAPDMARITVGVTHQAKTAAEAMDVMNADLQSVLDRLKTAGIEDRYMQTSQLRLNQIYEHYENKREVAGYEASSDLNVQVHDLPKLGAVLDAVVRDGANEMRGLSFDVTDRAPHLEAAREAAVADALEKATLYADAAELSLGAVLLMSEGGRQAGPRPMMEASFDGVRSTSVPIAAGELQVRATINMVWAIGE